MSPRSIAVLASLALFSADAQADRVVTADGRVLVARKARAKGGGYVLEFDHGTIVLADGRGVKAVEIEGDMSDYEPQNDDEREKLAKGWVRYQGKWMSKPRYEVALQKAHEESKAAADAAAAYAAWHSALEKETKFFNVRTNTSPELLDYYGELLDTYYKMMDRRLGIKPTPSMRGKKLWVNVYRSHEEFLKLSEVDEHSVLGYFMPAEETANLNFYHDYAEPGRSDWVALHECTHLLTYLIDQQFQPQIWINEAVADFFGSADIEVGERRGITIVPGKLQTDRVLTVQQAIGDGKAVPLEDLFSLERADFHGFEYAHAWSFVYFLNNGKDGAYQEGFDKFFKALYTLEKGVRYSTGPGYGKTGTGFYVAPEDIRDLLLAKIRVSDLAELEAEWIGFMAEIPIDAPEARLKRGLRAAMMGQVGEAYPDLTAAIDAGVTDARAYWARARMLPLVGRVGGAGDAQGAPESDKARIELALADIQRALELDPLNAQYRHDYSMLLLGRSPLMQPGEKTELRGAEARAQAGLATELAPDNKAFQDWFERFE